MEIRLADWPVPAEGTTRAAAKGLVASSTYKRRPPLFLYDPHGTNLGAGLQSSPRIRKIDPVFCTVHNARLVGQRLIADPSGNIVLDEIFRSEEDKLKQLNRFCNRASSLFHEDADVEESEGRYFSSRMDRCDRRIDRPVLSLLSVEPSNYGSWLFRVIPKLALMAQLGGKDLGVACWCPGRWQRDLLRFFGVKDEQIIDIKLSLTYEFKEIHIPVCMNPFAYLSDETLDFYVRTLERHGIRQSRQKLLYLSRISHARERKFINVRYFAGEEELAENLKAVGFTVVEPEALSIRDQLSLFASAKMVVGASGSGMFNTAFCSMGTGIIDIEAFPHWLYAHCNYFASCGHAYGLAFGTIDTTDTTPGSHKRWTIDIPGLTKKIDDVRGLL